MKRKAFASISDLYEGYSNPMDAYVSLSDAEKENDFDICD